MAQPQGTKVTFDHFMVKRWVEEREGMPARLVDDEDEPVRTLKIKFPETNQRQLQNISWDEFFKDFEEEHLAFQFQDETPDGEVSRFYRMLYR